MASKNTTDSKRNNILKVDEKLTTKFSKAEKNMIVRTAKKHNMTQRALITQSIKAFEKEERLKKKQDANLVNIIACANNIASDVHAWGIVHENSNELKELKELIERRTLELWKLL